MSWKITLIWPTPPLTANQRLHWAQRARTTRTIREAVAWGARGAGIPALRRCSVELHYVPADNRRRDADNLMPTLKVCCDGLVDAGVVPDDTPSYMDKVMPVIHPGERFLAWRLWLVIAGVPDA